MYMRKREITYKEYLRDWSIYDPGDLEKYTCKEVELPKFMDEELCWMNFKKDHKCIFGSKWIFAHSIGQIREPFQPSIVSSKKNVRLFKNLSFWVTNIILSFIKNEEILGLRTVNKEAKAWCQKAYAARNIELTKITLKTAQFFQRAVTLEIKHDSMRFFGMFKDEFFIDVLRHYSNLKIIKIDLNEIFEVKKKEEIIDKITSFSLKPHIEEFWAVRSMITSRDLESLTKTSFLENISRLCLSMNDIKDEDLTPLVTAQVLRNLKDLDLSSNHLTDAGIEFLVSTDVFENLKWLNLSHNKIENKGFKILVQAKSFPELESLDVANTKINKKGIIDLAISGNYTKLKKLVLRGNKLKIEGAKELSAASNLKGLEILDLKQWRLEDDGWIFLMKSHNLLKNITCISLEENDIGNNAIEILSKNSHLQSLSRLYLAWNRIQDIGII